MTGHGTMIIVSVYLPPKKLLLRSDIETLLALGDAVILFDDLNSKNTDWRYNTTNASGRTLATLTEDHELAIIVPLTQTHLPANTTYLKLGSFTGEEQPIEIKTIIDWKRVSTAFEKVDTPNLNVVPDNIVSNNGIDTAIEALTKHIRSVLKRCQRKVPANSDRRGLPADVRADKS
ncbi:hypothetical protein EVAR_48970_1 [Eumeta japonica]|uniref:Endonuclease/exonuclease/phosphatase domain-containing protein n=1 Tax=Eumeta variegata TaxID=151549 RepID=A0A4C1Y807_EUMVA|nr:hypothetical protein EVAR_48970_1 [Eumeta japonica]